VVSVPSGPRPSLEQVLSGRLVEPAYQPIVDLDTLVPVGYEALARVSGPELWDPEALFAAARACGRVDELDWLCREQAVQRARQHGLRYPLSLFINAEPETLLAAAADASRWASFGDVRCYAELTERSLAGRPAALLRSLDQVREQDWGIALDDVGADPESLALLPLLRPDVVKLDMRLLQEPPAGPFDLRVARVLHRVLAEVGQTGSVVVAEGVETEAHLDLARAYGAHYAQGYLLGRPGPLPSPLSTPSSPVPLLPRVLDRRVPPGPFAVLAGGAGIRVTSRAAVYEVARQLLAQAVVLEPAPVVLVSAGRPGLAPAWLATMLQGLSTHSVVAAIGLPDAVDHLAAVRTGVLDDGDPAADDFAVVVIGGGFAAALTARPTLSDPDGEALDLVVTFEQGLVCAVGNAVLHRLG